MFGSIHDGIFEGKIITDNNAYFVEHAKRYFPNQTNLDYGFHSVIYNERDVIDDPFAHKRKTGNSNGCGINEETKQWMENVQSSVVENDEEPTTDDNFDENNIIKNKSRNHNSIFNDDSFKSPYFKYTKEANDDSNKKHERSKRAARPKEDNRNTCSLYIQTDPLIWRHIREGIADVSIDFSLNWQIEEEKNEFYS